MKFTLFLYFIPFWSILILSNPVWSCFFGVVFLIFQYFKTYLNCITFEGIYFIFVLCFYFDPFWSILILFDPVWTCLFDICFMILWATLLVFFFYKMMQSLCFKIVHVLLCFKIVHVLFYVLSPKGRAQTNSYS